MKHPDRRLQAIAFCLVFSIGVAIIDAVTPLYELVVTDPRRGLLPDYALFIIGSLAAALLIVGSITVGGFLFGAVLSRQRAVPDGVVLGGIAALAVFVCWGAFVGVEIYDAAYAPSKAEWWAMAGRGAALIALATGALFVARASTHAIRVATGAIAVFSVATSALVGFSGPPASAPAADPGDERPNVVLFVIDTLRASAMGAYGYARNTTPHFDALSADAVLFENAYVQYTASTASHTSIQTGCYPATHGAVTNGMSIPTSVRTLASHFRDTGYTTAAFHNHGLLTQRHGFNQGFDVFVETHNPTLAGTPLRVWLYELHLVRAVHVLLQFQTVVPLARAWIAEADRPFFLWITTSQPHTPYLPPRRLLREFADPDYDGPMDGNFSPRNDYSGLSSEDIDHMRDRYDAEVRWADEDIARVLDALEATENRDDSVFVVSSDHGEAFAEHGVYFSHGGVHQESIHVPLLLQGPGLPAGLRVPEAVGLIDLVPTLLRLANPGASPTRCDGEDLSPLWSAAPQRRPPVLAWKHGAVTAVDERHQVVFSKYPDADPQLYDLAADPEQLHPLALDAHADGPRLAAHVRAYCDATPRTQAYCASEHRVSPRDNDAETLRMLRELGYVE